MMCVVCVCVINVKLKHITALAYLHYHLQNCLLLTVVNILLH